MVKPHTGKYLTDKVKIVWLHENCLIFDVFEQSHCVRRTQSLSPSLSVSLSLSLSSLGPIAGQKIFFIRFIVIAKWNIKSNAYAVRIIQPRDD